MRKRLITGAGHSQTRTPQYGDFDPIGDILTPALCTKKLIESFFSHGIDIGRDNEGNLTFKENGNRIELIEKNTVNTTTLSGNISYDHVKKHGHAGEEDQIKIPKFLYLPNVKDSLADLVRKIGNPVPDHTLLDHVMRLLQKEYKGDSLFVGYAISQPPYDITFTIDGNGNFDAFRQVLGEDDPYFTSFNASGVICLRRSETAFETKLVERANKTWEFLLDKAKRYHARAVDGFDRKEMQETALYIAKLLYLVDIFAIKAAQERNTNALNPNISLKFSLDSFFEGIKFYDMGDPTSLPLYKDVLGSIGEQLGKINSKVGQNI